MKPSAGSRHRRRVVETEEYVAMLHRMVDALARRLSDDPVGLVHVEPLREHLRDAMNIAIALNQEKPRGYSFGELAKILGMRRESVYERAVKGRARLAERRARLGVTSLRRHREARLQQAALPSARTPPSTFQLSTPEKPDPLRRHQQRAANSAFPWAWPS
ncbi:hypothetical protein GCM10009850_072240 [Nonomuraea monospora]|uniref:Helix-turn-helix domain-containing protein n=1 Tax=Nonomuraea monospora TaxID=568818 RepID=A0ABP5PJR2_9ACTN